MGIPARLTPVAPGNSGSGSSPAPSAEMTQERVGLARSAVVLSRRVSIVRGVVPRIARLDPLRRVLSFQEASQTS
jgi:hypothetical protein